jgi:mono/diheme cytochrome c family protein/glucose/arabinose dehydrogenase
MNRVSSRRFVVPFLGILGAASLGIALALHPQNAGPENVEIKFKLPPPKPLTPDEALKTFKLPPGFKIELVAAEPLVETPVGMSWDDQGRIYVVEMRGYMHDVKGTGENEPSGRVVILEDLNGDGRMDKSTVFADGLILPRAVMCVDGGALVAEPPYLWFMKDTNGDGRADLKEQVTDQYGTRGGQPEHMANSPTWTLDNWVHSANHATRYRLKDGKWMSESVPQRGQWGMSQDDYGRLFYNFNSDFLRANFVPEALYKRNPNFPARAGSGVQLLKDQTVWPAGPTPGINRGYEKSMLRADGTMTKSSATCGAAVYRGDLFPKDFAGNVFIPEPAANLVKRVIIDEKNAELTARNAYEKTEFLTSTDERFRPVTAYTGPDGALYLADMYRGVIQHKGFLTHYLIANIMDRKLEQPVNMGRIWRVIPVNAKPKPFKLPAETAQILPFIAHANGAVRDIAQRVLVERKDASMVPTLQAIIHAPRTAPLAKLHALWTLEGSGLLTPDVVSKALADPDSKVRSHAVRLADRSLVPQLAKMSDDPAADVRIALAFTLSGFPEGQDALAHVVRKGGSNLMVRDAALSGLRGRELEFLEHLLTAGPAMSTPEPVLNGLAQAVMAERRSLRVQKLLALIAAQPANSSVQLALLSGASGNAAEKGTPKFKLLYLDQQPGELAALAARADAKSKPLVSNLNDRIAWPGKEGVPPPPVIPPLTADEQKLFDLGMQTYGMLCAACHQANGQGMEGLAPPLVDSEWVVGKPDALPRLILHGLTGPIKVNGVSWNLEMPPMGAALSDEQIAAVVTYIRREWEHGASPMTPEFVREIRAQHADRTGAWTEEELAEWLGRKRPMPAQARN